MTLLSRRNGLLNGTETKAAGILILFFFSRAISWFRRKNNTPPGPQHGRSPGFDSVTLTRQPALLHPYMVHTRSIDRISLSSPAKVVFVVRCKSPETIRRVINGRPLAGPEKKGYGLWPLLGRARDRGGRKLPRPRRKWYRAKRRFRNDVY